MIRISLFLCTTLFVTASYAQTDSTCNLPSGGIGVCKPIRQCDMLLPLAFRARRNNTIMEYIQRHICGAPRTNSVCCPDCFTPDGSEGSCQSLENCPYLQTLTNSRPPSPEFDFIKNSMCRSSPMTSRMTFCCGPPRKVAVQLDRCDNPWYPVDPATECCGIAATASSRITGGTTPAIDAYPWLVLLEYKKDGQIKLYCGGSLISGKYVVTAAHCIKGNSPTPTPVSVRLGEYDTDNEGKDCLDGDCTDPAVSIPIDDIIVHPEYNNTTNRNDIALIRLQYAANYTDFIRPICLPTSDAQNEDLSTLNVYAAGWGKVSWSQLRSRTKQHVQLPLVDMRACQEVYQRTTSNQINLWSRQLCAGGDKGRDTCNGDSGGPLMVEASNRYNHKIYSLAGIVSYGPRECGTMGVPGVYTKVYDYKSWLHSHMKP